MYVVTSMQLHFYPNECTAHKVFYGSEESVTTDLFINRKLRENFQINFHDSENEFCISINRYKNTDNTLGKMLT